ncbi:MAG: hypothetical protein K0R18_208 [Bacillales bacterium]|jgi:regulator of protease activity HflC (stomatin/prohibitin superfamily)|nr:hypothetical protein [Bacillales bacterium]
MKTRLDLTTAQGITKLAGGVVCGILLVSAIFGSFSTVENGHVGFRKTMGSLGSKALEPGLHLKWPFISEIVELNTQVAKAEADAAASSKDLQPVHSKVVINYAINKNSGYALLTQIGADFDSKIIAPHVQETFKGVTAKYSAEELVTKREQVALETSALLKKSLLDYHIDVKDISIVNFDFSEAFNDSIEQKQIAAQNTMKAQNELETAKVAAQQNVVKAEADAQAKKSASDAQLYEDQQKAKGNLELAKSITQELIDYKFLQNWKGEVPDAWGNGSLINMLPSKTPAPVAK